MCSWLSHTNANKSFFPKPPTTSLTCFSRGEGQNYASTGYKNHNHQIMSPTCSPLSHPGGANSISEIDIHTISTKSYFLTYLAEMNRGPLQSTAVTRSLWPSSTSTIKPELFQKVYLLFCAFKLPWKTNMTYFSHPLQKTWQKITLTIWLTLSQTSPGFYVSAVQVIWKHCGKRRKLITSNFSFSHSVFYTFGELSAIFIEFEIVVCKLF